MCSFLPFNLIQDPSPNVFVALPPLKYLLSVVESSLHRNHRHSHAQSDTFVWLNRAHVTEQKCFSTICSSVSVPGPRIAQRDDRLSVMQLPRLFTSLTWPGLGLVNLQCLCLYSCIQLVMKSRCSHFECFVVTVKYILCLWALPSRDWCGVISITKPMCQIHAFVLVWLQCWEPLWRAVPCGTLKNRY